MSNLCAATFNDRLCVAWTTDVGIKCSNVFYFRNLKCHLQLDLDNLPQINVSAFYNPKNWLRLILVEGLVTDPFIVTVVLTEKPSYVGTTCQFLSSERVTELPWQCSFDGNFQPPSVRPFGFGAPSGNELSNRVRFVIIFEEDPTAVRNDNTMRPISSDFPSNLESLSLDFANLLKNETLSDVKLKCGGRDRAIPAHRSVLAARSEVFSAMFRNDMAESRSGDVDVHDVEDDVIDPLLQYVYSGKIQSDVPEKVIPKLYTVADKYAVHTLRETCRDRMVSCLTEENFVSFLMLADAHGDVDFKKSVIEYMCSHDTVFSSKAWRGFSKKHIELAMEAYESFFDSKTSPKCQNENPK